MNVTYFDPPVSGDRPLTGELWSPGPNKRTWWVRTDGTWVVVHLDSRSVVHNPRTDPRFQSCPGHMRYTSGRKGSPWTWEPSSGARLDCGDCSPTARHEYVTRFRRDRRDFTQVECARAVALFAS